MEDIKQTIRENYARIAQQSDESCCGEEDHSARETVGYDATDAESAPEDADMGLGCGNPTAIADLKAGETVLDLGCGGGFDCFLAANAVGEEGRIIGVDMTEEMIDTARENAARGGYDNVEFRLGEIENLPVEAGSVDVIISNCVINLVPDKNQAFEQAYEALKPGGRLHVSDLVLNRDLPEEIAENEDAYVNCISGAARKHKYLQALREAGFEDVTIHQEQDASELLDGCCQPEDECGCGEPMEMPEGLVSSVTLSAQKADKG